MMIVEDHKSLIDGLELLIKQEPEIEVVATATDGEAILEILGHKKAHLILTDISMPKMNGIQLCETVKKLYPTVKVVAFSMFDDENAVQDMIAAGADGYLLKTRSLNEVLDAIKQVMTGETVIDATITVDLEKKTVATNSDNLLSRSEREILKLIAAGKSSSQIAEIRHTAVSTVHKHRKNMILKLDLHGKGELLRYALQRHSHYN